MALGYVAVRHGRGAQTTLMAVSGDSVGQQIGRDHEKTEQPVRRVAETRSRDRVIKHSLVFGAASILLCSLFLMFGIGSSSTSAIKTTARTPALSTLKTGSDKDLTGPGVSLSQTPTTAFLSRVNKTVEAHPKKIALAVVVVLAILAVAAILVVHFAYFGRGSSVHTESQQSHGHIDDNLPSTPPAFDLRWLALIFGPAVIAVVVIVIIIAARRRHPEPIQNIEGYELSHIKGIPVCEKYPLNYLKSIRTTVNEDTGSCTFSGKSCLCEAFDKFYGEKLLISPPYYRTAAQAGGGIAEVGNKEVTREELEKAMKENRTVINSKIDESKKIASGYISGLRSFNFESIPLSELAQLHLSILDEAYRLYTRSVLLAQ